MSFAERPLDEWQSHVEDPAEATDQPAAAMFSASATKATAAVWGWLPALTMTHAGGLLLLSFANVGALSLSSMSNVLFWLGLALMLIPTAMRLIGSNVARQERIGLVISLGMGLYLVKLMQSPFSFTYSDEFLHLFNTNQILQNQSLFTQNLLLPVSPLFPGLPSITAAIVSLTDLSTFQAGAIVIGIARLLMVIALFLFAEEITRSPRIAGLTTLFFMCNSNFLYWGVQYSYESLSLPLVIGVFYLIARRTRAGRQSTYAAYTILSLLIVSAIVITHHLSSYFLVAFLFCWWALVRSEVHLYVANALKIVNQWRKGELETDNLFKTLSEAKLAESTMVHDSDATAAMTPSAVATDEEAVEERGPEGVALFSFILALAWLTYVALTTYGYISVVLSRAGLSLVDIITGSENFRQLFVSADGYAAPLAERIVALAGVVFSLIGLPFGLYHFWHQFRKNAAAWLLSIGAVSYFAMLPLRLSSASWETSNRASVYFYVGLAFILALAADKLWPAGQRWMSTKLNARLGSGLAFALIFTTIFAGGVMAGRQPQLRLAQPFVVDVGETVIETQGVSAARWMREKVGTNHQIISDEVNGRLMLAYAEQNGYVGRFPYVRDILRTPNLTASQIGVMQEWDLEYAVVDRREAAWDNSSGYFFDPVDAQGNTMAEWSNPLVYEKFDRQPLVSRIMDTGEVVIYDMANMMSVARKWANQETVSPELVSKLMAGNEITSETVQNMLERGAISPETLKQMIEDGQLNPSQIDPALLPPDIDLTQGE